MPFYMADFLNATSLWSGEERALYMLLLAYQWENGGLPSTLDRLSIAVAYNRKVFNRLWQRVSKKFQLQGEVLVNPRLEEHRRKIVQALERKAEGGRHGAANRWGNRQLELDGIANRLPNDIPSGIPTPSNDGIAMQSQSQSKSKTLPNPPKPVDNSPASISSGPARQRPRGTRAGKSGPPEGDPRAAAISLAAGGMAAGDIARILAPRSVTLAQVEAWLDTAGGQETAETPDLCPQGELP